MGLRSARHLFSTIVPSVTENNSIAALWPLVGLTEPGPLNPPAELPVSGRPLVNLTFAVNYYFGESRSIRIPCWSIWCSTSFAAMLFWAIVRRRCASHISAADSIESPHGSRSQRPCSGTCIRCMTESVIYVTQCTELMMGLFYLATLYCSLRYWSFTSPSAAR